MLLENIDTFTYLVDNGIDNLNCAITWASKYGYIDIVNGLLKYGSKKYVLYFSK